MDSPIYYVDSFHAELSTTEMFEKLIHKMNIRKPNLEFKGRIFMTGKK